MAKSKSSNKVDYPAVDKSWQAEEDARTLMRANEIRKDKARTRAAVAWAKKKMDDMKSVAETK
jgi:hypothetical protein